MKKSLLSLCLCLVAALAMNAATNEVLRVDFENGLPDGWTQEFVQLPVTQSANQNLYSWAVENGDSLVFPAGCVSGTHRVKAANTTNQEMRFITRLITAPINLMGVFQPQLVFSHAEPARAAYCDTLRVYYRTSPIEVWRPLPNAEFKREAQWQQTTLNIVSYSATTQLAFEISENKGRGVVLDDIIVRATPTCQDVDNIVCSRIHAYDATLSWDAFGAYNEFQVLVADTVLDTQNIDRSHVVVSLLEDVYDPSTVVTGLQPETTYYVYVRSDCDEVESGYTNWVSTSFRTLKVAYLPYSENFNRAIAIPGEAAYGVPDGWTFGNNLDIQAPFVLRNNKAAANALYSIDTTAYVGFVGEQSATPAAIPASKYVYAATPEIVAPSLQGLQVRFWVTAADFVTLGAQNYAGELIVGTIADPQDFRTFHPFDTVRISGMNLFRHVTVNMDSYTGTDKFVALASRSQLANAMFVDNFTMSIPDAPVPTNVRVSKVNSLGFEVAPVVHGADSWDVVISTEYSRTGAVTPASIVAQQSNITAATYTLNQSDLEDAILHVYTRTHKGSASSDWSFAQTVRIPAAMPVLGDDDKFTLSFEKGNRLALSELEQESRFGSSFKGLSEVYYPLRAVDATINMYPKFVNTAPNYVGGHLELCGADTWFVLPEATDINTLKMVFRHSSKAGLKGALAVGVMTDPYDLSTFEQLASFTAEDAFYERRLVSFDAYAGTGKYIAFRALNAGSGAASSTNLIDEVVVSKLGTCREASNISIVAHSDHATMSWNGGGMNGWVVGLSAQHNMLNATYTVVNQPTITFNGLEQETTYYCTIQQICGNDTVALEDLDDVRYSFYTPHGLPFIEEFAKTSLPAGWMFSSTRASSVFSGVKMTQVSSSSSDWKISGSQSLVHAPMSGNIAYFDMTSYSDYGWLVSPELYVDADPSKPLEMVFDLGMASYTSSYSSATTGEAAPNDLFMVVVSDDGGNTWLQENATVWNNTGDGDYVLNDLIWDGGEAVVVDFTKYIGKRIKIGFYAESTSSSYRNYLCIDNVVLREGDERCGGLGNLRAFAPSVTTANATWQLAGQNPWPAVVQLANRETFATLLHNDTVQGTSITYSDLEANTTYYVRARQLCDNDENWKRVEFHTPCTAVTPEQFGTETFEDPGALNCWTVGFEAEHSLGQKPAIMNIDGFGSVLQIAKTSTDTAASDGAYAILPQLELDDQVKDISHYQIIFKAATTSKDEKNCGSLQVYILTDPTDITSTWSLIKEVRLPYAADSTQLKTYVISFENYLGDLVNDEMGHYVMFFSQAGTDSLNYIVIDDVMLTDVEACHMVLDLEADSISSIGARLHWSGNGTRYEVAVSDKRVLPDTCTTWLWHQIVDTTFCHVSGLQASSTHCAYIRAICADGDSSRWSSATYFKTARGVPFLETFDEFNSHITESDMLQAIGTHLTGDSVTLNLTKVTGTTYSSGWLLEDASDFPTITGMEGKVAKMNIYGTQCFWMVFPTLDMTTVESEVRFSAKVALTTYSGNNAPGQSTDDRLGIMVSLDGGKVWHKKNATFWSCDGTGQHQYDFGLNAKWIEVDLTDYVGSQITLAIMGESTASGTDNWLVIDSVHVEKLSSECLGLRKASFEMKGQDQAVAHWHIFGTPEEVEYILSDDPSYSRALASGTTSADSVEFSNLVLDHSYFLRLNQVGCTTFSNFQLHTPYTIPFAEAFTSSTMPGEWAIYNGNADAAMQGTLPQPFVSTQAWKISMSSKGLPANHLVGEIAKGGLLNEKWLVSPDIVIPAGSESVKLQFDAAYTAHDAATAPTATAGQELRVLISTDGGHSWTHQWIFSPADSAYMHLADIAATGSRIQLPMDAFVGQKVRFAFYKSATANDNDIHIANVQLREFGAPCAEPTNVRVSDIGFTTATVTWSGQANKMAVVEYSNFADFTNAKADTVASDTVHALANLYGGATYFVRVKQICAANSISEYSESAEFSTLIGLPYSNPLTSIGDWKVYQSALADSLAGVRTATTNGWTVSTNPIILDTAHVRCTNYSRNVMWLISPVIDLTAQQIGENITLAVDLALTQGPDVAIAPTAQNYGNVNKFYIAVSTDNGATFPRANAWEFSADSTAAFVYKDIPAGAGATYRMDFSRFAGQQIRIAFVSMATKPACINAARLDLDLATSMCYGIANAVASAIDTAATITISPRDNAQHWEVSYGKTGTPYEQMRTVIFDSIVGRIGGLELNSSYELYVRSICGEGDTSALFGPYKNIVTPLGIPYQAPFDNSLDDWNRYTGDVANVQAGSETLKAVNTGWTAYNSKTAALAASHVYCLQSTNDYNWLVSPEINLMPQDGSKGIWLSFNAAVTSTYSGIYKPQNSTGHTFRIIVSEDNGVTWPAANTILWGDSLTATPYASVPAANGKAYHLDLTKYAGKKIRIALVQGKASAGASCIHINELELTEYAVPCFGVDGFTATLDGTTAACVITDANTASTAWQYVYVQTGASPVTGQPVTVTSKRFGITLPPSSTLDIYVRSICGASDTSAWIGPRTLSTPNGVPFYESFNYSSSALPNGWSTEFTNSYGEWKIGQQSQAFGVPHAYTNNYSSGASASLVSPEINMYDINNAVELSFDLALTGYSSSAAPSNPYQQTFDVRVSTNGGTTFDDPIAVWGPNSTDDYVYADIPNTGEHYTVDLTEYVGSSIVIGFFTHSEGGDCNVHLRDVRIDTVSGGSTECTMIKNMSVLDSTYHTATIAFRGRGVSDAIAFEYACIRENSIFSPKSIVRTDTNVVQLKDLNASSGYEVFARMMCPDSIWSDWNAEPWLFHTVECSAVTGIAPLSISMDEELIKVITPDARAAHGYQASIVPHGQPLDMDNVLFFTSDTLHFMYPLEPNALYDVHARKICEVGDTSAWAEPYTFESPKGVPFFESLNLSGSALPEGWSTTYTNSYGEWKIGKESEAFGVPHAYTDNYSGSSWLKTPVISTAGAHNSLELSFDMALTDYGNSNPPDATNTDQSIAICISTDGGRTFDDPIAEWTPGGERDYFAIPTTGSTYVVDLSAYSGSSICVGFYARAASGDNDLHIANVAIDTATYSCESVHNVQVSNVTTNAATVSYRMPEGVSSALVEVATDNAFNNLVFQDTVAQSQYDMRGLSASTGYYVRVLSICSDGNARWSEVKYFHTSYGVRYLETFDTPETFSSWTQSTDSTGAVFASGKITETSSGTYWSRSSSHSNIFPSAHPEMNIYSKRSGWLISPTIDLTANAGQGLLISFDLALCAYSGGGTPQSTTTQSFYFVVSEDAGRTWSRNNLTSWVSSGTGDYDYSELGTTPKRYIMDMTRYAGKQIKLGFCSESTASGGDNYIMFDNIDLNAAITLTYSDTICEYEDYDLHGFHYDAAALSLGLNEFTVIAEDFDTVTNLSIFVREFPKLIVSDTICEGESYTGHGFDGLVARESGAYEIIVENPDHCDSIITVNLTVIPKAHIEIYDTLCDGSVYTFHGQSYYHDIILMDTLSSLVTGCDSIVTYYITFSGDAVVYSEVNAVICAGQRYRDDLFSENKTGTYYETTASVAGCDSVVTLNLFVADADGAIYDTVAVEQLPYSFMGQEYIPVGAEAKDYVFALESVNEGCSPELRVHVANKTALPNVNSLQLSVSPNPVQAGQTLHILTDIPASADFRATVYNAIGKEVYSINGYTTELPALYASGIYMVRITCGKQVYEGKILVK